MGLKPLAWATVACVALAAPFAVMGATTALKPLVSASNKPWPAAVAADNPNPPALSTADELKTFTMPKGYHLELVASEPLVQDPIVAEFDGDGRLWVLELKGWGIDSAMNNTRDPVNDLVILEDTNGDGIYDKRTVFMDNLVLPRAFKILDHDCALVGEPPNLWKACDTNGDLKSDTKEQVDTAFAANLARSTAVEHGGNALYWGMDNLLRIPEQAWDLGYKDGKFSEVPGLSKGQWGASQDDGGRIYRNVNTDALFVDYLPAQYYLRNPDIVRTSGLYEPLIQQDDTRIWPAHPTPGVNRGYRPDIYRPDGTALYYQGVSSPMIYRGTSLPQDMQGQAFVVDGPTNLVHALKLTDTNGNLAAADMYKQGEFLNSTDERFRPVYLTPGWDGTFYIVDMYRGVSQDGPDQTDYLRDYIGKKNLAQDIHRGRIFRVVYDGMKADNPRPNMLAETPAQLVAHLSNPNGWWRDTAQQLLVQRADKSVVPALQTLARSAPAAATRLQAMWTLDGLGAADAALVTRALSDSSPDLRAAAVRLSEHWLSSDATLQAAVLKLTADPNWTVRRQLAGTLGVLPPAQRLAPAVDLLGRYGDDAITVDAAISSLSDQEMQAMQQLIQNGQAKGEALAMLTGAVSKSRNPGDVQTLIAMATDSSRPAMVRSAVLRGLNAGLTGQGASNAPAQAGLSGTSVPGLPAGGGGGGRGGGRGGGLTLAAAPAALVTLSQGSGDDAANAQAVVNAVSWPGKPVPPPAAALSAADQARFDAGKTIFQSFCVGCHGADGQGIEHLGAKLAGSPMVAANSDVMIRILTAGKEGSIGLMPPLGAAMSDDDLASVITYARRSFGNTASAVVPAQVKETRSMYAYRKTPWTDAELLGAGGGRGGGRGGAAPAGGAAAGGAPGGRGN